MNIKRLFILLISSTVLIFVLLINIVNGQVGNDSSEASSSGGFATPSSTSDTSEQKIALSPEFNGTWAGIIASYPAADDKNSDKSGTCIKCDALPQCESNQILIQRTCTKCAYCVDKTSKDFPDIITDFVGDILTGFGNIFTNLGSNLTNSSSSSSSSGSSSSGGISSSSSGLLASSSSSSGGFLFSTFLGSSSSGSNLSDSSLGNVGGPSTITKQSNTIGETVSLDLFIKEGKLNGAIQIGSLVSDGYIVAQNAISPDEVQITVKNKMGKAVLLKLKLFGKPSFIGIFLDGISIEGRYLTPFYSYLVPSGKAANLQPQIKPTPTGGMKPTMSGRPGGTGRAGGGESGGRAGGDDGGRAGGDASGRAGGDAYSRPGGDDGGRSGGQGNNRPGGDDDDSM